MNTVSINTIRLIRKENDGRVWFDFKTSTDHEAGFSRTAGGFIQFNDKTGHIYFDLIGDMTMQFAEWSHSDFFAESAMNELTGKKIGQEERDRLQLEALNARLASEGTGLHIDTWNPETGVITATVA